MPFRPRYPPNLKFGVCGTPSKVMLDKTNEQTSTFGVSMKWSCDTRLRRCELQLPRHPFLAVGLALGFAARGTAFVRPHLLDHRCTTSGTAGALQSTNRARPGNPRLTSMMSAFEIVQTLPPFPLHTAV